MKLQNLFLVVTATSALLIGTGCQKKVKIETDIQKASYAIGQQIGGQVKSQDLGLDVEVLAQSIKEAANGDKPAMTPEEMQAALQKLQEVAMKKRQEKADSAKKEGSDFLEKNKTAAGVKVTASGLQYIVETEGKGEKPKATSKVKVHYTGTLTDGKKFDSSYDRKEPAEFVLNQVIPGWTEALQLMNVGSKWKIFVPSDLGYGAGGVPGIPPNSVLIFEVELLDIVKK